MQITAANQIRGETADSTLPREEQRRGRGHLQFGRQKATELDTGGV